MATELQIKELRGKFEARIVQSMLDFGYKEVGPHQLYEEHVLNDFASKMVNDTMEALKSSNREHTAEFEALASMKADLEKFTF